MTAEKLRDKLLDILEYIEPDGGTGLSGKVPLFDYYASDYLEFSGLNLENYLASKDERTKENELISCVANLKRALDNQIECFLEYWNLRTTFSKKSIGLNRKLDFLSDAGFFSSRTIKRFGTVRNKVEHEFQKPKIGDLESLFDLVTALVSILRVAMTPGFCDEMNFVIYDEHNNQIGFFDIRYNKEERCAYAQWGTKRNEPTKIKASLDDDPQDFSYFIRVIVLLNQIESHASLNHIRARLKI